MKCLIIVALVPLALVAAFGHHGGPHGPMKVPKVCEDAHEQKKQCVKNELQGAGVTFDMEQVRECLKQCPRPERPEPTAEQKAEFDAKKEEWAAKKAEWEEKKQAFDEFKTCMEGELGDSMEQCVDGKVDFETVERKHGGRGGRGHHGGRGRHGHHGRHGGKGGKGGKGGRHGRHGHHHGLFERAECSDDVKACVQGVVGDWYGKQAELKQAMCDATTKCEPQPNEQCDEQFKQLRDAGKACYEENKDKLDAAKDTCKDKLPEDIREKFGQHKERKQSSSESAEGDDDESSSESREHRRGGFGGKRHNKWCEASQSVEEDEADEE